MSQPGKEPIAVIGSACRFAEDTNSPSKLWKLLQEPRNLRRVVPENRFNSAGFYHEESSYHGRTNVRHGYFIEQSPYSFDAEFFGVKPVEAKAMDPQQRLLMEIAFEALESAGLPLEYVRGSDTGVYVGAMCNDFGAMAIRDLSCLPVYTATGTAASLLSNRLSYFFDWHGPSMTIDTACSSSLVAVHMAVQALRSEECSVALVCGSNLILGPENFVMESKLKMLSPDGQGRMWDQGANGYARGEGVGVMVLKPLSKALRDGDPIECVVRETALSQDGASDSAGITIPNAAAQEALISATYRRAGLDLDKPEDRPQFFEAHGTGTAVGDPIEAEAIYNAFSSSAAGKTTSKSDNHQPPLYVGSIKTVLGHTEGTAGLAAMMKTSLALNRGVVPPNMLMDRISDRVAPFYQALAIPLTARQWPDTKARDGTRRASVNSFGFGGTNAHAILESYDQSSPLIVEPTCDSNDNDDKLNSIPIFAPYVFSAFSDQSLQSSLSAYHAFLSSEGSDVNPRDLSWTLRKRRSIFPYRASFPASSVHKLKANIAARLAAQVNSPNKALSSSKKGRILGIFTGQGQQYPRMGAELIEKSAMASSIIGRLETTLAELPDAPEWSLRAELLANASSSRVHEAALSQPLCTAVQIVLIELVRLAGIEFDTVVGHSSGEIAAAYAAGFVTANDAIRIAYYRGVHLRLASSPNGQYTKGAMLAVESSVEDMEELCQDPVFSGRLTIAACNSPSSFTMSGDEDAIDELRILLEDEKKFNRRLRVDKAYHSAHMLPCFKPYVDSLLGGGVQVRQSTPSCTWVSSVYGYRLDSTVDLTGSYWAENMTQPVLFSQAVENAFNSFEGIFDLVMEIGAHPTLKGPCTQTIQPIIQHDIPYTSMLSRGVDAVEASSACLGTAWAKLESGRVDLDIYDRTMSGARSDKFHMVRDLPTYSWNHEKEYLSESRISRRLRARKDSAHSLLGDATPDSAAHHMSWRNLLRLSELEWMSGHRVEGQTVFPAAGYLVTALEAAKAAAGSEDHEAIRLFELHNFVVNQAIVFESDDTAIEVLIQLAELTILDENDHQQTIRRRLRGRFTYAAALPANPDELTLVASADVEILLGAASVSMLPMRKAVLPHMVEVEGHRFYQALAEMGYEFSGHFRVLSQLQRRHFRSSCRVDNHADESLLIHPGDMDALLQACMLAYSYPFDDQLRVPHLPTAIQCIRVNPGTLGSPSNEFHDGAFIVDARIRERTIGSIGICGDVSSYHAESLHGVIQIQGVEFRPIGAMGQGNDRQMFSKVHWINTTLDASAISDTIPLTNAHRRLLSLLERIATFYTRQFDRSIPMDSPLRTQFPLNYYLNYCHSLTRRFESGDAQLGETGWMSDTLEDILEASREFEDVVDVEIMHLVGKQMPRVFRGETTMLQEFRAGESVGILDRYYAEGYGLSESAQWVSRAVKQITDRYPHMNILEIGAGTGGATKAIFREIGQDFRSYTYTDISAAFFENASHIFVEQRDRLTFKTFDAEQPPQAQGYAEGGYDLVVAFFVIHTTRDMVRALRHVRQLLRPGGFLVVGEGQDNSHGVTGTGFIFGTLPGWWLGADRDGRGLTPLASPDVWDSLLQEAGFSTPDISVPTEWTQILKAYHFVVQAVDDQVRFLREPLNISSGWRPPPIKKLVIVGGLTERSVHLVDWLQSEIGPRYSTEFHVFETLVDVGCESVIDLDTTVLCLTELDKPVFQDITPLTFMGLRRMFESGKKIFWVTRGRLDNEPYCNMTVGFGRVAVNESPDLQLQMFDVGDFDPIDPRALADAFLRFCATEHLDSNLLWSLEPEVIMDKVGHQLVPRLLPIPELNDRYNSVERHIVRNENVSGSPVLIRADPSGYVTNHCSTWESSISNMPGEAEDRIELRVTFSTLEAIRTPFGYKFLALGTLLSHGASFLTLAPSLCSVISVPKSSAVPITTAPGSEQYTIASVAARLVAWQVLDPVWSGQAVILHNASETMKSAFMAEAAMRNIEVTCFAAANHSTEDATVSCVKLPGFVTSEDLSDLLPADPVVYVNFGHGTAKDSTQLDIISCLPRHCRIDTAQTLFSPVGTQSHSSLASAIGGLLDKTNLSVQNSNMTQHHRLSHFPVVSIASVVNSPAPSSPLAILDFRDEALPIQANRLDMQSMFKGSSSTYWVVGMTGALGVSLCDWMIAKGAKNIAITSRKPEISPEWVESHKKRGATIAVMACDITNERELKGVYSRICQTLPPVTGVINGAMVLRDVAIRNMTFDQLVDVTRPKVEGSVHLDRIFHTVNLDFFVLVSSVNCVIGSWGQANYAAANMFMCGLAGARRRRGLRASAVNVGAIIGAGYMERESRRALDAIVRKLHMMRLSEEDWHQAICEAIDASRLESAHGPEITTGLSLVSSDTQIGPTWAANPRFSKFIVDTTSNGDKTERVEVATSIEDVLKSCPSRQDLHNIVTSSFATQLRVILQVTLSDEDLLASRSNEIGLDSLVSVDVRSWFLKNFQVNIPTLKIMGSHTMASLVEFATGAILAKMTLQIALPEDASLAMSSTIQDDDSLLPPYEGTSGARTSPERDCLTPPTPIDWTHEAAPPASWALISHDDTLMQPSTTPRIVVLTGATGLLGHHLLDYILKHTSASKIHCLAVRGLMRPLQINELIVDSRVEYHAGKLEDPNLGLSETECHAIFSTADVVIHNGADTSHAKTYHDMQASNVGSTQTLAGLCVPRRIPFHYISSAGVAIYQEQDEFPEMSLVKASPTMEPPVSGAFGYGCSKWVSERLLEQAHDRFGLPVYIYRPSTIMREGADADLLLHPHAALDWVNTLLHYIRALGAAPRTEHNHGVLDLVRVGTCCRDILSNLQTEEQQQQQQQPKHVHSVGDTILAIDRLHEIDVETERRCYDVLPMPEWISRAMKAGLHPGVALLIEQMDAPGVVSYPRLLRSAKG